MRGKDPKHMGESRIPGKTPKAQVKAGQAPTKQVGGVGVKSRSPPLTGDPTRAWHSTDPAQEGEGQAEGDGALNELSPVTVVLVAKTSFHSLWTPGLFPEPRTDGGGAGRLRLPRD